MARTAALLHSARRPEAAVFPLAPDIDDDASALSNRLFHDRAGSANSLVFTGEAISGLFGLDDVGGPGATFLQPRGAVGVEDTHLGMAEKLHQPESHRRRVPVEDNDRFARDA